MKFTFLFVFLGALFLSQPAFSMIEVQGATTTTVVSSPKMDLETFKSLTPEKYQELTGKKLGFFGKLKLKAAQKMVSKQAKTAEISKGLYIVLAILGFGWLAMGLLDDFGGSDWIISLVLYFLLWLPGFIYTLIKMKKYY